MACRCNRMGALRAPRRAGGTFAGRSSRYAKTQFRSRARRYAIQATGAPGATTVQMPNHFKKLSPQGNKVLIRLNEVQDTSPGGILLPSSELKKPTLGTVVATGPGCAANDEHATAEVGSFVLYSKWGFMTQEITVSNDTMVLVKEEDLLGSFENANATVDDIPNLTPLNDRVVLKVDAVKETSSGGVIMTKTSSEMKERPVAATVVSVGPGRYEEQDDGSRKFVATSVAKGDRVVYFRWAGDAIDLRNGDTYVIIPERDILGIVQK